MPALVDLKPTLAFLGDLKRNNNKAWFDANRARYEDAKGRFEAFVDALIAELDKFENLGGVTAKDSTFRINRDIRFSKDKTPYKTNMSADIAPGGRKSGKHGYYIHLAPGGETMLAGGMYMPTPEQLSKFRAVIAADAKPLKLITGNRTFVKTFGSLDGDRLKTAPKGYPADHPEIELLKMKQFVVAHRFSDKDVLSADFVGQMASSCKALKPFLDYLNATV
jgi:uncharacterized protein (TIGR02453 family)